MAALLKNVAPSFSLTGGHYAFSIAIPPRSSSGGSDIFQSFLLDFPANAPARLLVRLWSGSAFGPERDKGVPHAEPRAGEGR